MTYFNFLLIFIFPLVTAGMLYVFKTHSPDRPKVIQGTLLLILCALFYTTPWDNYLVKSQVWSYEDSRILFKIFYVPFEEYLFFILQSLLTCSWCYFVMRRTPFTQLPQNLFLKKAITVFLIALFVLGLYWLGTPATRYLGLITAWVTPVILLQWIVGGQHIMALRRWLVLSVFPPTIYLWVADSYALSEKTWVISETQTTGVKIFNLPIEEALFFLATNFMLVQGLILYVRLKDQIQFKRAAQA